VSDYYRGFPLTQNEAAAYLKDGTLPDNFGQRVENWLEFGACENCDNRRCMHFVMRDWWDGEIDRCDGYCCPDCDTYAKSLTTTRPSSQSDEGAPPTPLQEQPSEAQSSEERSTCAEDLTCPCLDGVSDCPDEDAAPAPQAPYRGKGAAGLTAAEAGAADLDRSSVESAEASSGGSGQDTDDAHPAENAGMRGGES